MQGSLIALVRGGFTLLKLLEIIFSIIAVSLAVYGLIVNHRFQSYMLLSFSLMVLVSGLIELRDGKKGNGWVRIVISTFILFVSVHSFLE
ncbi:hypothetical protein GCM10011389_21410 [Pontibacillus salipaludis]|uniref:DUF3953 domain-containing protein n=1 Tax=Pontibacillus salipaludis TaxID=1697394 RepID=A0ABQ1Q5D2_9BACI|nr:hypothetical protein GCM10011389_21410 [Pontibacillus salipaludis]